MGLFDKKFCDICGDKIGLLGNRKLENGNLCGKCAKKLSPFFSERRRSTVEDIKSQLAYREENRKAVSAFNITRTLGKGTKILLDEDNGKFIVSAARKLEEENPDVMSFSQVTGCNIDIEENRSEEKQKDADGKSVSYNPPRYTYDFDFYIIVNVNTPWFNEIRFKLNTSSIKILPPPPPSAVKSAIGNISIGGAAINQIAGSRKMPSGQELARTNTEYLEHEALANEIKEALTKVRETVRENIAAANAPKTAKKCPECGAACVPDAQGRCEYCGAAMAG